MKRRSIGATGLVLGILLLMMAMASCNKDSQPQRRPVYTEHTSPAKVTVSFAASSKLPALSFHIDHRTKRIYNKEYLPFEAKVDSAYLRMAISNEATVRILNTTTNKMVNYLVTDTGKIDLTGGKLQITIEVKDAQPLTYDFRLLTYGYNPLKYTWRLQKEPALPVTATDAMAIQKGNDWYWIARRADDEVALYKVASLTPSVTFEFMQLINTAKIILPRSIHKSNDEQFWALDEAGGLWESKDLKEWQPLPKEGYIFTQILADTKWRDSGHQSITVNGYKSDAPKEFLTIVVDNYEGVLYSEEVTDPRFPVRDAFVLNFEEGGIYKHHILSGMRQDAKPSLVPFFTSDGFNWAVMPYLKETTALPEQEALFLASEDLKRLYFIGGKMEGQPTALMKLSKDKGISWDELTKEQLPGVLLKPRYNASGILTKDENNEDIFYIFGGIVDGKPSQEIWRGWVDRTGGIINAY